MDSGSGLMAEYCRWCGWLPAEAKGLCSPCRQYRWKYGKDRPIAVVMRHVERANDRRISAPPR